MQIRRLAMTLFCALPMAALMYGCGSSSKEGSSSLSDVATVGDTACIQCHSSLTEPLTGESLITQYQQSSPHNANGVGCEACHGGGTQHNGVGPIPYPIPDANRCATCHNGLIAQATNANTAFETSNHVDGTPSHTSGVCVRCHTHEGAVLSNKSGFTGDGTVIDGGVYLPPAYTGAYTGIKCETCHEHGGGLRSIIAKDTLGRDVAWNPSKTSGAKNNQFNLCTSCHTMYDYTGNKLLADGIITVNGALTGTVGHHTTSWYRMIASTHFDDPLTTTTIEGYNIRKNGATPCFDCHGHEAKTGTRYGNTTTPSIHTDWAQSGHAGKLLANKYASNGGSPTVASVFSAGAIEATGAAWVHYDWDATTTVTAGVATPNRGACQKCHTATGISNMLNNPDTYDNTGAGNDFTHLSGWKKATATASTVSSGQNEVLYCWGCHSNAGKGTLRNTTKAVLDFTYQSQPIVITNAGKSTACVTCHGGRGNVESPRSTRFQGHHAPTAGFMYNEKTHMGYEYAGKDYSNATTHFQHDTIGANADGPCASCHMGNKSHTFAAVTETAGTITGITNQTLCNTCHTVGGPYEMTATKLEEEKLGYQQASTILNNYVNNVYTNPINHAVSTAAADSAQPYYYLNVSNDVYGAFQNAKISADEPGAYVHNRTYVKRLIFDSIDFMDNGVLDGTITLSSAMMTAYPDAVAWLRANATTGVASRP
ncbi:C-type polyheme cytochrome OmcB [Trichlorobacter lovleyi]|uniref:C-type polyheme cytochrome OmcB n=1 Tax=Trichlorobacter lovleyi TaxID=313985 RepID=UPI00223F3AC1|nr:C-type polyheme cytochrome OmcB [Trichlorobacter lovleyi]QOX79328.1 C-type polyheme cytochrome OmcB [Trichlorobacter lovleyi]